MDNPGYESDTSNASNNSLSKVWWNDNPESTVGSADDPIIDIDYSESDVDSDTDEDSGSSNSSRAEKDIAHNETLNNNFCKLPQALTDLRKELLGDYTTPDESAQHHDTINTRTLSISEIHSLQHYVAWRKSNGTIQAYKLHAAVLEKAMKTKIMPIEQVKKLAQALTKFVPHMIDMCPRSCIAYTGDYAALENCPYIHGGVKTPCNESRYRTTSTGRLKPRAQVQILPVMATIRAMFANEDTAKLLRHRDSCLQEALRLVGSAAMRSYSDFRDSQVHMLQHQGFGLFQDPRDIGFALSTDGAQLTMKKQSNTWLMILIILNLLPST